MYLDVSVDDALAVAKIEGVSNGADDLADLALGSAAVEVLLVVEFASLHVLHHDVEVLGVVVHFVDVHDVGMF